MPITIARDEIEQNIIRLTFEACWTWDEYHAVTNKISAFLSDVTAPVDVIVDLHSSHVPDNAIRYIESGADFFWHPQTRLTVLVGVQGFLRTLLMLFVQIHPRRAHQFLFAGTVEHAYQLLVRQQAVLDAQSNSPIRHLSTRRLG